MAAIEAEHEGRYLALLSNVENELVFRKGEKIFWICRNCGHIHEGLTAPEKCPTCQHPKSYFEQRAANWR